MLWVCTGRSQEAACGSYQLASSQAVDTAFEASDVTSHEFCPACGRTKINHEDRSSVTALDGCNVHLGLCDRLS
jgi:hypothetical protein